MYNVGRTRRATVQDSVNLFVHFSVFLENIDLIPNASFEELKKVNYMNKRPSNFCLFENKFAVARNTRNIRRFVNP
jgi:hypothetical protein